MIVTRRRPGSIIEQMKIIEPLTNPAAHGASSADAFHLVIPSLPGGARTSSSGLSSVAGCSAAVGCGDRGGDQGEVALVEAAEY